MEREEGVGGSGDSLQEIKSHLLKESMTVIQYISRDNSPSEDECL